jgi:methionyl-tRNA formyltransferase
VPILPDDTAKEVFDKVTLAAEIALDAVMPALLSGDAPRRAQVLANGSYFGGRRPEDGRIDWMRDATAIHNLVRAVAPPYPGAFTSVAGVAARVLRTRVIDVDAPPTLAPTIEASRARMLAHCGGGGTLAVLALEVEGAAIDADALVARFGGAPLLLR